eukprot:TRINITY_DN10644_c0_g1_i2.p1 TRINITY_DN10644_c0_g1~~TRINITY_DN10644_c0_g1_i2.p1  ORF type:complete len:166 (-),score=53.99 TRINITY_DN10644_c0_g1_i2:176-673(-)
MKLNEEIGWELENAEDHPLLQPPNMSESCDRAFIEYCTQISKFANEVFFAKICSTVLAYRQCLNKYGWQKLFEEEEDSKHNQESSCVQMSGHIEYTTKRQRRMREEYARVNKAEKLPEVANEFVVLFAKEHELGVAESEVVEIVMNMCEWMHDKGYTKTRVELIC